MTVTKLTIIALSAAAIVFGGCSTDNRITGPGNDFNPQIDNKLDELNLQTPQPNTGARIAVRESDSGRQSERFTIFAKVEMLDLENGCWYLLTNNSETYTPIIPGDLTLKSELSLKAEGYVDKDIQFFCGNGPAFVIENYEILDPSRKSDDDRDSGINDNSEDRAPSRPAEERAPQDKMDREREVKKKSLEERVPEDTGNERP